MCSGIYAAAAGDVSVENIASIFGVDIEVNQETIIN
jgi:hypothetical protein